MLACICIAALFVGLWLTRSQPWASVIWSDRVKPSVFLIIAAVLIYTAETTSLQVAAWVVSGGQYLVAAAAVIAAAIVASKQSPDTPIPSRTLPGNAEPAD